MYCLYDKRSIFSAYAHLALVLWSELMHFVERYAEASESSVCFLLLSFLPPPGMEAGLSCPSLAFLALR